MQKENDILHLEKEESLFAAAVVVDHSHLVCVRERELCVHSAYPFYLLLRHNGM